MGVGKTVGSVAGAAAVALAAGIAAQHPAQPSEADRLAPLVSYAKELGVNGSARLQAQTGVFDGTKNGKDVTLRYSAAGLVVLTVEGTNYNRHMSAAELKQITG